MAFLRQNGALIGSVDLAIGKAATARIFDGSGAKVVALARNADKLNVARQYGANHVISVKGKSSVDIAKELNQAAGQKDLDAIMDCAGAPEMMQFAFSLLSIMGHYADVGLVGDSIDIPLFPRVSREQTFHGSFWGTTSS